ncbi:MAG: PqiC family protein [Gammaproteobacteria bacterium]|nr:PqiC family protein [Gammaproteobacteria bacterium]
MIRPTALLLVSTLLAACTTTPEATFYRLGGSDATAAAALSTVSLSIGPIELPQYLDRPQIVSRDGANRLRIDEFHRWGGSLQEEIHRLLAARLGERLATQRIYRYPSRIVAQTDYRIAIDVRVFDGVLGGAVQLDVAWSLIDDRSADVLVVRRSRHVGDAAGADYAAYAAALGSLLERLADDLAAAIAAAKKNPPGAAG